MEFPRRSLDNGALFTFPDDGITASKVKVCA